MNERTNEAVADTNRPLVDGQLVDNYLEIIESKSSQFERRMRALIMSFPYFHWTLVLLPADEWSPGSSPTA